MDLTNNPTKEELRDLLASAEDDKYHHIIWVDKLGIVYITPLDGDLSPAGWFEENRHRVKFRYETCVCGNDYVGENASRDEKYVNKLFSELLRDWQQGKMGYIDY